MLFLEVLPYMILHAKFKKKGLEMAGQVFYFCKNTILFVWIFNESENDP